MSTYTPLQTIIESYPYVEYSDDENIVAFFEAFNELAQGYLNWFNATPLAVYTNPNVSGPLLDWIATGIYGIARPVFSSETAKFVAGLDALPLNVAAVNGKQSFRSGTATIADDDYYKRVLTWWLYAGNGGNGGASGRHFNVEVLRLKVARFIYGPNGADVTLTQAESINIQPQLVLPPPVPTLSSISGSFITDETGTPVLDSGGGEILGESPGIAAHTYAVWESYVNSIGETLVGPPATLAVADAYLLVVHSPPHRNGAVDYNVYATVFVANPAHFKGALNTLPVNGYALNGNGKRGQAPPELQNASPIPIGTNWTEPETGLVAGRFPPTMNTSNLPGNFIITIPSGVGAAGPLFQQAFEQGALAFPFQFTGTVVLA